MDDQRENIRPSGLLRPSSRLPVLSSTTTNTVASTLSSSTASRPTMALRAKPSRESLSGGDLRNPKLRAAPSQDRLRAPALASSSNSASLAIPKTPLRNPSARTRAVSGEFAKATPRATRASMGAPPLPSSRLANDARFARPAPVNALSRKASTQQLTDATTAADDEFVVPETLRPKPSRSRLSLAERTMETLAQIPSSPAVKGKVSAFYGSDAARNLGQRPGSRAGSRPGSRLGSRPGSSYQSDGSSNKSTSRPSSRPQSSSGHEDAPMPNFRATASPFRTAAPPPFVPIDEASTPGSAGVVQPRVLRSRASVGPGIAYAQRLGGPGGLRQQAEAVSSLDLSQSRTISPEKMPTGLAVTTRTPIAGTKAVSKTMASRPLRPRASVGGLFQKPSKPAMQASAPSTVVGSPATTRKSSLASRASSTSYEDRSLSNASTASTALSTDSADSAGHSPVSSSRKSSAALREQIAKAKAAKRIAASQPAARRQAVPTSSASPVDNGPAASVSTAFGDSYGHGEAPLIPTDTTFDFGLSSDPFNQNRDGQTQAKMIKARVAAARGSGRLNIAALNLREIPAEVMSMYDADAMGTYDGSWAETVDLTRFVAADNEIELIDDSIFPDMSMEEAAEQEDGKGNIFGGLETLDLHGNMLISLPMGLRRLQMLTSLNLSQNRITNNALEVISQISSLRDLKLGGNLFYGPLDPCFAKLSNLEIADLHGNNISALPLTISNMTKLRILNISENVFEDIVFEPLSKLPLTELHARKNKLSGVLIEDVVPALPSLQILDITSNQISQLVSQTRAGNIALPALQQLLVSMNRLQSLPPMMSCTNLLTLVAEENNISSIPEGFTGLGHLRRADFSSNDIRVIPSEIGRMENLAMLRLNGNPLRDKKFCTANTDEIKDVLLSRLEPELEPNIDQHNDMESAHMTSELRDAVTDLSSKTSNTTHSRQRSRKLSSASARGRGAGERGDGEDRDDSRSDDDFATPPTSLPQSPARSRSHTQSNQIWTVKNGGVLDRSETEASSLHPVVASRVAQEHTVHEIYLQKNLFTALPDSLSFFAATLTTLTLSRNQLRGETYLGDATVSDGLDLPALKELNLSSNHITGLGPLVHHIRARSLQKLDVSMNRIASLPADTQLRDAFPDLTVLLAANNHLVELDPESIKGLRVVDVSNNDIEHLNPRIGLLGGEGGLQRLEVLGNRFRVPRFNVIERGTEAILRHLRGRVPVAEMGAWRETSRHGGDFDDDLD